MQGVGVTRLAPLGMEDCVVVVCPCCIYLYTVEQDVDSLEEKGRKCGGTSGNGVMVLGAMIDFEVKAVAISTGR